MTKKTEQKYIEKIHQFAINQKISEIDILVENNKYLEAELIIQNLFNYYSEFFDEDNMPTSIFWTTYIAALTSGKLDDPDTGINYLNNIKNRFHSIQEEEIVPKICYSEILSCYGWLYYLKAEFKKSISYLDKSLKSITGIEDDIYDQTIFNYRISSLCHVKSYQYENLIESVDQMAVTSMKDLNKRNSIQVVYGTLEVSHILNTRNENNLGERFLKKANDYIETNLKSKPFYEDVLSLYNEFIEESEKHFLTQPEKILN